MPGAVFGLEQALDASLAFFSYCRADQDFAFRLAQDLKAAGANVWMDQLDIEPGAQWDQAVEEALDRSGHILVLLSPVSVASANVRDEISYGLGRKKTVIPILYRECDVPFRLARLQRIDFTVDYDGALRLVVRALNGDLPLEVRDDLGAPAPYVAPGPPTVRLTPRVEPARPQPLYTPSQPPPVFQRKEDKRKTLPLWGWFGLGALGAFAIVMMILALRSLSHTDASAVATPAPIVTVPVSPLVGSWTGTIFNAPAGLAITTEDGHPKGELDYQQEKDHIWETMKIVENDKNVVMLGVSYRNSSGAAFSFDTLTMSLSDDGSTLTGRMGDQNQDAGKITFKKNP